MTYSKSISFLSPLYIFVHAMIWPYITIDKTSFGIFVLFCNFLLIMWQCKIAKMNQYSHIILNNANEINIVPKHFMYGPRKLNVTLTQLRCSASFLNHDLFKSNIVSSPNCACGVPPEDIFHFFFECSKYTDISRALLICVNRFRM